MNVNDPKASPDLLGPPPKRGVGVRRLNKLPLIITGVLVALVIISVSYTFNQRREAQMKKAEAPADLLTIAESPALPVKAAGSDAAYIDAIAPPSPPPLDAPGPLTDAGAGNVGPIAAAPPVVDQAAEREREARLQALRRIEENKLQSLEAALNAPPGVENFKKTGADAATSADAQLAALARLAGAGAGGTDAGTAGAIAALAAQQQPQQPDPNGQAAKRGFNDRVAGAAGDVYLRNTREPARSRYEVKAGSIIPAVLISGINSDLPGQLIAQVRENVYASAADAHGTVLIPQGARLVGTYDSAVTMGQRRVLVAWQRVIYPDGSSVSLGAMQGADQAGYAGFRDKVDNHYLRIYGNAFLLSLFSAGIQLSQPDGTGSQGYDSQQILAAELGRQLGQLGIEMTRRNMDIAPTLEIRPGYNFVVMVNKDMILPAFK